MIIVVRSHITLINIISRRWLKMKIPTPVFKQLNKCSFFLQTSLSLLFQWVVFSHFYKFINPSIYRVSETNFSTSRKMQCIEFLKKSFQVIVLKNKIMSCFFCDCQSSNIKTLHKVFLHNSSFPRKDDLYPDSRTSNKVWIFVNV